MGVDTETIIRITGTSAYPFEFIIVLPNARDVDKAKAIASMAYDEWWDKPTDSSIGDYISQALQDNHVEHKRGYIDLVKE